MQVTINFIYRPTVTSLAKVTEIVVGMLVALGCVNITIEQK